MEEVEFFFKGFGKGDKKWDQIMNPQICTISGPNQSCFLSSEDGDGNPSCGHQERFSKRGCTDIGLERWVRFERVTE